MFGTIRMDGQLGHPSYTTGTNHSFQWNFRSNILTPTGPQKANSHTEDVGSKSCDTALDPIQSLWVWLGYPITKKKVPLLFSASHWIPIGLVVMILPSQLISRHIFNQHLAGQLRAMILRTFFSLMRSEVPFMIEIHRVGSPKWLVAKNHVQAISGMSDLALFVCQGTGCILPSRWTSPFRTCSRLWALAFLRHGRSAALAAQSQTVSITVRILETGSKPHIFWAVLKTHTDIVMVLSLDHQNGLLLFVGTWLAWFLWFHAQNAQNVRLIEFRINQCVSLWLTHEYP